MDATCDDEIPIVLFHVIPEGQSFPCVPIGNFRLSLTSGQVLQLSFCPRAYLCAFLEEKLACVTRTSCLIMYSGSRRRNASWTREGRLVY